MASWVADCIEADPASYDQSVFFGSADKNHINLSDLPTYVSDAYDCSTACCIGGWAASCYAKSTGKRVKTENVEAVAARVLGLSFHQATKLFAASPQIWWPRLWAERWGRADSKAKRAAVAVSILRAIAKDGPDAVFS